MEGIFRILKLDPSVSLIQQTEINDMLLYGSTPTGWKRVAHFLPRASYEDPTQIPTCCGPWHNGAKHFVTFYLCPEYWTLLDPYDPNRPDRWAACETQLDKAL